MAKKRISKVRRQIEKEWPSALAFGTILPDYNITEDPTFTRERTGAGSIEYFNEPFINYGTEENPNIILNPNGYEPTLLYNPDTNTVDDVKLDLLHHYRQYDPAYLDLLLNYEQSLLPKKDDILWNSLLGDVFREKYNYDAAQWSKHMDEWENIVNSTPWESEYILLGVDGSLRNLLASDETIRTSNYAPREDAQRQWLSTPESKLAFDNILTYLTGYRLPEVEKVANKRAEGGALRPEWNSLSMRERAAYIRDAVSRGLNTVTDIRNDYNMYGGGGTKLRKKGPSTAQLKANFLKLFEESLKGYERYATPEWRTLLTELVALEDGYYEPYIQNSIGAKGYFQLMPANRSATWTNPLLLFHEMYKLTDANMEYFKKNLTDRDLKLAASKGIDIYGLIAGAHLAGAGNTLNALRGGKNVKDKNNSSVLGYMTRFSQMSRKQPVSGDFKTVYFQPPIEETPEIEAPNPYVGYKLISLEDIDNLPLPSRIGDDEIAFEGTAPETIITPEPQKLYIQYTPKEIFDQMSSMITPYEPVELPKPLTATERLKELSDNRVSLLLKDLEDSIIRSYRLNDFDKEKLRRDVEDLLFYRNMAAYGGNLFSGEDTPTQQMNSGLNLYRNTNKAGDVWYTYQETPDSEEILLTPTNKRFSDDPTNWDYKDASGRKYSPRMTTTYNPGEIREDTRGPLERMVDNYFGELKYQVNNNVPISGEYTMPAIAAAPFLAWAGEAAYPYVSAALANPYVDAGLTSAFAGHGLNHAINEGIDGWGDAAITALEIAPLGRLAKPILNEAALAVENYRYPFGRPQVPEGYITVKPQVRTRVGDVEIDNPNVLYHTDWGDGVGAMAKINESQGIPTHGGPIIRDGFLYPGTSYTEGQKAYTWWNLGKPWNTPSSGSRLTTTNVDNPLLFPVRSSKEPIGQWNGRAGFVTKNEYVANEPVDVSNSTYVFRPDYGWRRVFAEETPVADWPMGKTTPQITAENAASMTPEQLTILGSASDSPYKDDNGFNLLVKHLYNKKIHGYPSLTTDAMQFDPVAGEFTPVKRDWADDVITGLPRYAQNAIMHDVVDRNIAEFMKEGLSYEDAAKYAEAAKNQLNSVRSGTYSQGDYNKAGWGDFGGFYDPKRNFISVNEADNPKRVYTHEGRHLLDHKIDDEILFPGESTTFGTDFDSDVSKAIMQRTRLNQEMILRDAYDSDFESIPSSKYAEGLEDYNSINREAITTNLDSRTYAYDNFADINSLNSGTRIEELPTEAQNSFIDGLTDELVFEAIEHANGYGRRYINRLRDEGKLTSKKAQQFREAMKHVGVAAFPVAAGAGLLFGLNNL